MKISLSVIYRVDMKLWGKTTIVAFERFVFIALSCYISPLPPIVWIKSRGGGYSPQILVGMCRGKVKNWQGLRNELPVERENGGLRNEFEPFWAWKWGALERAWSVLAWKWDSPEMPGCVWLTRGAENGTLRNYQDALANPRRCVRAEPAVGGDERVEIKEILKMMVSGLRNGKIRQKM